MAALALERLLLRDRLIAGGGVIVIAALGWAYVIGLQSGTWPALMAMPMRHDWQAGDFALMAIMWIVMMVAMMTPAVAPTILLTAMVERRRGQRAPVARAMQSLGGYLAVWAAASLAATLGQWAFHEAGLIDGPMGRLQPWLGGATLIAVGLYQFAPLKLACLKLCRSPVETLAQYWSPEPDGALRLGLRHGFYCLGCCWALMLVLFVCGVMNLLWVAILAGFVLVEKLLPPGLLLARLAGLGLVAWGGLLLIGALNQPPA
jgi:predicted metal-binding membrane protein